MPEVGDLADWEKGADLAHLLEFAERDDFRIAAADWRVANAARLLAVGKGDLAPEQRSFVQFFRLSSCPGYPSSQPEFQQLRPPSLTACDSGGNCSSSLPRTRGQAYRASATIQISSAKVPSAIAISGQFLFSAANQLSS